MKTKLIFLVIICLTVTLAFSQNYNHDNGSFYTDPKAAISEHTFNQNFKTQLQNYLSNLDNLRNNKKPSITSPMKPKTLSKQKLWTLFDYLNRGYVNIDEQCKGRVAGTTTGCCMRGRFYEDEACWTTLITFSVFATAFFVSAILVTLTLALTCCCVCMKTCKRKRKMEEIKKRLNASKLNTSTVPTVPVQQIQPVQVQPVQIQQNHQHKKCNCPVKKIEKNLSLSNLSSTNNDFSYQPPKLTTPLISRPQQPRVNNQIEMNNTYPKFNESEVSNPYPKFEFIVRSNY